MRRFRNGDPQAFEEIDRRYRPVLTRYAAHIVPADRADDVVQEALTKASFALLDGEGEMNLQPWLYRIVRNTALNDLRDAPPPHEELDLQYDGVPQPPDIVNRREELRDLVRSIKALPAEQRRALVQRELEGRSHDEIADSLEVSAGAVRQLIFRARQGLREGLAAVVPLPAKALVATVAVSGTVATGVAINQSIGHHRHQSPGEAPVSIAPVASSAPTSLLERSRDRDEGRERSHREGPPRARRSHRPMTRPAVAPIASVPPPVASPPDSAQDVKHSGATTLAAKHVKAPGSGATAPLDGGSSHGAGTHGAGAGGGGSGSSYEHDKSKEKGKKSA